ncbi:hypothetical protein QQ045_022055 [Rhodiola kirilowii]
MVKTVDGAIFYGILENIIQLNAYHGGGIRYDYGLIFVDTSSIWYENSPYCLAIHAIKVFYLDDPKAGDNWKVVNIVAHRGIYSDASLARDENVDKAYQEDTFVNIPIYIPLDDLYVDLGSLPRSPPQFGMDDINFEDDNEYEDEDESDGEDEDGEDEDDESEEDGDNEDDDMDDQEFYDDES